MQIKNVDASAIRTRFLTKKRSETGLLLRGIARIKRGEFSKKLIVATLAALLSLLAVAITTAQVQPVLITSLFPNLGTVGSTASISGTINTAGGSYSIGFDINGNGWPFDGGEIVETGTAQTRSREVSTSFVVPSSFGSDSGISHAVGLRDDTTYSAALGNFSIRTSRALSAPSRVRLGDPVSVNLTITGGNRDRLYAGLLTLRVTDSNTGALLFVYDGTFDLRTNAVGYAFDTVINISSTTTVGNYSVVLREQSPSSVVRTANFQVEPRVNQPPTATIDSITPGSAVLGQQVTFSGHGTDPDGVIVGYRWTSSIDGLLSTSSSFSKSSLSAGTHTISFQVRNNDTFFGLTGVWSSNVSTLLRVNHIPNATIVSIVPSLPSRGQRVALNGEGVDQDGFIVGYKWTSSIDGLLSTLKSFTTASLSEGSHVISFQVQDNDTVWSNSVSQTLTVGPPGSNGLIPPNAVIDSITPSSAILGQQVEFSGHGTDEDGFVIAYRWTSSIDGLLSTSADFAASNLSEGTHTITFEVQDDSLMWSVIETRVLVVGAGDANVLWIVAGATACFASPPLGFAAYRFYVGRKLPVYPIHFVGKPPSSLEIAKTLKEKVDQEAEKARKEEKEQEEEKKKRARKHKTRKGKPDFNLKVEGPLEAMGAIPYEVKLNVKNVGESEAKEVVVSAASTFGLELEERRRKIAKLKPEEERPVVFKFTIAEKARKGVYTVRFEARSQESRRRSRSFFTRAVKIGLLCDPQKQECLVPVRDWLKGNSYSWEELSGVSDFVGSLLSYDLLILVPELELPKRWAYNVSSFVENGQSLLAMGEITASEHKVLAETLGYAEMKYEDVSLNQAVLTVLNDAHAVMSGFKVGDQLSIGDCQGKICVSKTETGKILAESPLQAVIVNEYGEGKAVHLNFPAENSVSQLNQLLKNSIKWLLQSQELRD